MQPKHLPKLLLPLVLALAVSSFPVISGSLPGATVDAVNDDSIHLRIINTQDQTVSFSIDGTELSLEPDSGISYFCNGRLHLLISIPGEANVQPIACSSRITF